MPVLYVSKNLMCRSGLRRRGDPQSRPHRKSRADLKTAEALEQYKTCILYYLGVRTAYAASSAGAKPLLEQRAAKRCAFCMQARAAVPHSTGTQRTPGRGGGVEQRSGRQTSGAQTNHARKRRRSAPQGAATAATDATRRGTASAAGSRRGASRRKATPTMYFDNYVCTHYLLHGNIYLLTTSGGGAVLHPPSAPPYGRGATREA